MLAAQTGATTAFVAVAVAWPGVAEVAAVPYAAFLAVVSYLELKP
jgi:hypothetical protein